MYKIVKPIGTSIGFHELLLSYIVKCLYQSTGTVLESLKTACLEKDASGEHSKIIVPFAKIYLVS